MNAEKIIGLIDKQIPYSAETQVELNQILEDYPYFQTARLLYALNLKSEKDTRLSSELRKTACYQNDRSKLFFLMEEEAFPAVRIAALEKTEESTIDSPFDLIDSFLKEKEEKYPVSLSETKDKDLISTDYISYLLAEDTLDEGQVAVPMKHQDRVDRFLSESEKAPFRIELPEEGKEEHEVSIVDLDSFGEESFLTETLAKIYIKQKKYDKALEIIRQLYLRNPEKNRYFADQIRFLEKLIINIQNK